MQRVNTMEELTQIVNELEIDGKFYSYFFIKSDFKYFFFLEESDSVALYFFSMVILRK
jgi:hypothetical protein